MSLRDMVLFEGATLLLRMVFCFVEPLVTIRLLCIGPPTISLYGFKGMAAGTYGLRDWTADWSSFLLYLTPPSAMVCVALSGSIYALL